MSRAVSFLAALVLVVTATPAAAEQNVGISALQKVIQMLTDMAATAKTEKHEEEVGFAQFNQFCTDEQPRLQSQIQKAATEIETLEASINERTTSAKTLGEEIATLQGDVAKFEGDLKGQNAQRESDNKAFLAEQQDYGESVDAIERAINVLSKQNYDRAGAASALLQLSESAQLPANAKAMIAAFVGMMDDNAADAPPEANAYEFQSGGIIDMLKKLKDEFRSKKAQCEKEEMNSRHAHSLIVQDLSDSVENSNRAIGEKTTTREEKLEQAAGDKKQFGLTTGAKAADEEELSDLKAECSQKKMSYEEKQKLRAEEIQAIGKAVEILSSDSVSGNAEKHLSLAQTARSVTALAQLRSVSNNEGIRRRVREFLMKEGQRLHSTGLNLLAEKLEADPFAKVKKLIDGMITRLLGEANEDAQHEGFCDKEVGQSKITRTKLSEDIDGLEAQVENGKAAITTLTADVAELTGELADLDRVMAEATTLRKDEKAKNAATVKDAKEAKKAVAAATAVLKDFYEKSGGAATFVQLSRADPKGIDMLTVGAAYKGKQEEAGGVLAILEVVQSDFGTLQADTEAAETASATEYDEFTRESKKNKAVKSRKIEMNNADLAEAQGKLVTDTSDMKATQDRLLAAERYYSKLVPQCIDKGQTFEERTSSRQEEIQSLKEALTILEGEAIA